MLIGRRLCTAAAIASTALTMAACGAPGVLTSGSYQAAPAAEQAAQTASGGGGSGPMSADQMDDIMAGPTKAFPAATSGVGGRVMQPSLLAGGVKEYDLVAAVTPWEVSPGKIVQAWTYNGTVPGPTIHVNVGDHVRVVLTNHLPESTTIHFHGVRVPNSLDGVPDITQPPVKPGQTFTYDFVAREVAVGMYHSHDDAVKQVTNSLAGAFLVGEEPLPRGVTVSQELPFMLDDSGAVGLSINGKSFPATAPIVAKLGDYVLVHYFNEGLMAHPMHLHGPAQLVVAKDGYPLSSPYLADTVMVGPGERYSVLVHADELGTWAWHCHILNHAEGDTGMFGMVTALVIK